MLMEGQVKFFSPLNSAGVSLENGDIVMSQTNAVPGDKDSSINKSMKKP